MRDCLQLKKVFSVWLMAMWTASAWAASTAFTGDLSSIPPAAVAVAVALALVGGATATLQRIANPETVIKNLWLEVARDILSSVVAGLITYFVCAWQAFPALLQAGIITVAGYGGARVLERYLSAGLTRIDGLGVKPEGTPR